MNLRLIVWTGFIQRQCSSQPGNKMGAIYLLFPLAIKISIE